MKDAKKLFGYAKGSRLPALLCLFFALVSVFAKLAIPYLSGLAIQNVIDAAEAGQKPDLTIDLLWMGVALVVGTLFRYFYDLFTALIGQKIVKGMRDQAYAAIDHASVSYLDAHYHGDLLQRLVNDIENVQTGLISGAAALFEGVMQILITLAFMFSIHWALALTVVLLTPISVLMSRFISKRNSSYFKEQNQESGQLTAFSLESLTNLEASKAYSLEGENEEKFDAVSNRLRGSTFKAIFAAALINPATRLVNNTIYAVICFVGGLLIVFHPNLGVAAFGAGALHAMLSYAYQYMAPFNEVSSVASEVSYALASFRRIDELIHNLPDQDAGTAPLTGKVEQLEAKDVHFSYDGKREIIHGFNLDVYKGHKIALVGPTGCGKTTIINLLLRFYDPQIGAFYINGERSDSYPKKQLRSHIGMVLQETWLFRGSVRENIAYGKKGATLEEVVEAAKKAHADSFIRQMPQGYDTPIGNNSGLSTGQKQLLCLARVMLMEPEIVVLDEATSNIDLRTELLLGQSFDELMRGKTSLIVAHRLSTIRNADLIVVMKDGSILEQGNFQELMAKKGFFKTLYDAQLG